MILSHAAVFAAFILSVAANYCGVAPGLSGAPLMPSLHQARHPLADDVAIVQAHVMWRHGDRTPATAAPCWPNDDAVWVCEENQAYASAMNGMPLAGQGPFMRLIAVKGGMYFPGNCAVGQLTLQGYEQELANGAQLRDAYVGEGKLLSSSYSPHEVRLQCDTSQRVQMSTLAVASAMFDLQAAGAAGSTLPLIDVHYLDTATDWSCPNPLVCPGLSEIAGAFENSTEFAQFLASNAHLVESFGSALNMSFSSPEALAQVHDCYWTHACHNFSLPAAVTPAMWEALSAGMLQVAGMVMAYPTREASGMLSMGPFLAVMRARMLAAMAADESALRFYGFGSHDLCIMPVLAAFGLMDEWCPYAGVIAFELYGSTQPLDAARGRNSSSSSSATSSTHPAGPFYVRLLAYGEALTIPGCSDVLCPWEEFEDVLASLMPPDGACAFTPTLY